MPRHQGKPCHWYRIKQSSLHDQTRIQGIKKKKMIITMMKLGAYQFFVLKCSMATSKTIL